MRVTSVFFCEYFSQAYSSVDSVSVEVQQAANDFTMNPSFNGVFLDEPFKQVERCFTFLCKMH